MKAHVICDGTPEGTKVLIDGVDIGDVVTRVMIDIGPDCQPQVVVHLLADVDVLSSAARTVRDPAGGQ